MPVKGQENHLQAVQLHCVGILSDFCVLHTSERIPPCSHVIPPCAIGNLCNPFRFFFFFRPVRMVANSARSRERSGTDRAPPSVGAAELTGLLPLLQWAPHHLRPEEVGWGAPHRTASIVQCDPKVDRWV